MKSQYFETFDRAQSRSKFRIKNTKNLRTWVEVDTNALKHNLKEARRVLDPNVKLLVVVKSNAYGYGLVESARVAAKNSADYFGVDSVEEGIQLRESGITTPILVLGYILNARLFNVLKFNFETVAYNRETIAALSRAAKKYRKNAKIHLKIETGTSRQGIMPDDLQRFTRLLKKHPRVKVVGVYTHFSDTENPKSVYYREQLDRFEMALALIKKEGIKNFIVHAASSAALWLYPETHFDMVRMGISYYGLWPSEGVRRIAERRGASLKPAMSWRTRIAQVKYLKKGTWIGYDCTERLKKDSAVAVLPVGYWDGYDRKLSGRGEVVVRGRRSRVLGRVCMNMMMVDVSDIKDVKPGEVVTLIGKSGNEEIAAEDLARRIGTIHYEIIARINPLLPRLYS